MFSKAYQIASCFTFPLLISTHRINGAVDVAIASFVVVNKDGWILTAAHVKQLLMMHHKDMEDSRRYDEEKLRIEGDQTLTTGKRKKLLRQLKKKPDSLDRVSYWWGKSEHRIEEDYTIPEADIMLARLASFDPNWVKSYPVFKKPDNLMPGTSLCRLGFPFSTAAATYDDKTGNFTLAPGVLPLPRFPIDGILTRELRTSIPGINNGDPVGLFIETSSPGLRGQSGGPIFDTNGVVWSIQSQTHHLALGFRPSLQHNGKMEAENQFLNVGLGVHPGLLFRLMTERGIDFAVSED
mgnify:CR=1 FL=1